MCIASIQEMYRNMDIFFPYRRALTLNTTSILSLHCFDLFYPTSECCISVCVCVLTPMLLLYVTDRVPRPTDLTPKANGKLCPSCHLSKSNNILLLTCADYNSEMLTYEPPTMQSVGDVRMGI
jgi:hypothetical protein